MHYLSQFESIGDNCEFGLLQQSHGIHDGGLFKWAQVWNVESLIDVIENNFRDAFVFENAVPAWDDMIVDAKYRVLYHSKLRSEVVDGIRSWTERSLAQRRLLYAVEYEKRLHLVTKFREIAAEGSKIFVFKANYGVTGAQADRLADALGKLGPTRLLVVEQANGSKNAGDVEVISPNLLKGYIERFAPYENAHDFVSWSWERLCKKALRIENDASLSLVG